MKSKKERPLKLAGLVLIGSILMATTVLGSVPGVGVAQFAGNDTSGEANGKLLESSFSAPYGLCLDKDGGILVVDSNNSLVRKLLKGEVSTTGGIVEGLDQYSFPMGGYVDGKIIKAKLNKPRFTAVDSAGAVYISDTGNNAIRKLAKGEIRTFAGNGTAGYKDGLVTGALFNCPSGVAVDGKNNVYVADSLNNVIRKITPQGLVTTFAGIKSEDGGYLDGPMEKALFNEPSDLVFDKAGALYVLDTGNQLIRKIENNQVTTYCGHYTKPLVGSNYVDGGFQDGYGIDGKFNFPKGLEIMADGTLLVADSWNNAIRAVLPNQKVVTLAGTGVSGNVAGDSAVAQFNSPADVLYTEGQLYISDMWNNSIKMMPLDLDQLSRVECTNSPGKDMQFGPKTGDLQLAIDGKIVKISSKKYRIDKGLTLVSIQSVGTAWGGKVTLDKKKKTVKLVKDKKTYTYKITKKTPLTKKGEPMEEIRALSSFLGLESYALPENNGFMLYIK